MTVVVRCDCGVEKTVSKYPVLDGRIIACGCKRSGATHRKTHTPTYGSWCSLRDRCIDPTCAQYDNYGGRGITVCDNWKSFENFYADMGERPADTSINRIDNDSGYWCGHCEQCVANGWTSNCEWASQKAQSNNKRNNRRLIFHGVDKTISEWSEFTGINRATLNNRVRRGWTIERALTANVQTYRTGAF